LKSTAFVQRAFREYYHSVSLTGCLSATEKREFGFVSFEGQMLRHRSFKHTGELTTFLQDFVPRDAYLSCAYYEDPEAEMEKKGWMGADLIFDVDADHIPTSCDKIHDFWVCGKCEFTGRGITPDRCPVCGGEKFDVSTWPCESCLRSAKEETVKVLDMLTSDFGLSNNDLRVFFSGHRGYHVQVESEAVRSLDAMGRKEIVDYVSGIGFDVTFDSTKRKNMKAMNASRVPASLNLGWRRRIAQCVHDFIFKAGLEDYRSLGLKGNVAATIISNKDKILRDWGGQEYYSSIRGIGFRTWERLAEYCMSCCSANIDTVVTTDIHRLIRLTGALHGKTGFKKVEFPISAIDGYDPFRNAIAFKKGTVNVFVSDAPEFRLGEEAFGPYKNQKVALPTSAALLLVCKDRAEVVEQDVC
jgi:DNA primase small subunit